MKEKLTTFSLVAALFLIPYAFSIAAATTRNIGGRVLQTRTSPLECTAQYGPMTIQPLGAVNSPAFYFISATTRTVRNSALFLGKYDLVPNSTTCFIPTPSGPAYIPAFELSGRAKIFNTSKRL